MKRNKQEEKLRKAREATARWYKKNREKKLAYDKIYRQRQDVKDRNRKKVSEWAKRNPDKAKAIAKRKYQRHGNRYNEIVKLKRKNDADFIEKCNRYEEGRKDIKAAADKKRYWNNPDKFKIAAREWREKNPERAALSNIRKQTNYVIAAKDIPKELIELEYIRLQTIRSLKKIQK